MHTAERYHDISCGHRVTGHESKCRHLHGHNYRIHFVCIAKSELLPLDDIGRVIDFSVIKERLCMWIENNWDHKFLAWERDPVLQMLYYACTEEGQDSDRLDEFNILRESIVWTPFNPTAENMAQYLVDVIGPNQLTGTGVKLVSCRVDETMKCSATYSIGL
jgi:6-pyruvoyltetrahydropterin/6-carboxytetrahydropterin synthase